MRLQQSCMLVLLLPWLWLGCCYQGLLKQHQASWGMIPTPHKNTLATCFGRRLDWLCNNSWFVSAPPCQSDWNFQEQCHKLVKQLSAGTSLLMRDDLRDCTPPAVHLPSQPCLLLLCEWGRHHTLSHVSQEECHQQEHLAGEALVWTKHVPLLSPSTVNKKASSRLQWFVVH